MSLENFDALVSKIEKAHIFHSQLNNIQISIKRQVLIILKCFSIYNNDILLYNIMDWVSIKYSIIHLITQRVIIDKSNINLKTCHIY